MQKGSLLLCVASLGIAWVHASTTSAGYCCPQITVALGTEDDGTYNFLTEGNGPAMEQCQDACIYYKDSNKTDIYCFQAVTSEALGSGQVQCEAVSPYSLLMSTTPAVTGPTTGDLLKKIEDLQKDFEAQVNQTEALKKDFEAQVNQTEALKKDVADLDAELKKEVEAREAEDEKMITEINSIDGRLNKTEKRTAVCGYQEYLSFASETTLTFNRVYDEVNSGGVLDKSGYFTAKIEGVYLVTLKAAVSLDSSETLVGYLKLSSGSYYGNTEGRFIYSYNQAGGSFSDQASASRYVKMTAGETLHILLVPVMGEVEVYYSMLCVSLYSASG